MLKQILAAENLNQPNLNAETENLSDTTDDNGQLFVKGRNIVMALDDDNVITILIRSYSMFEFFDPSRER
jgi:hypothetical protein